MIRTLFSAAYGAVCGFLGSICPGMGAMQSIFASSVVGVIGGDTHVSALSSYAVYSITSSVKSGLTPTLSGDANIVANSEETAQFDLVSSTVVAKVAGVGIGLSSALFFGQTILSFSTMPITWIVAVGVGILMFSQFRNHWLAITCFLIFSQAFFAFAAASGISNPVFLLGASIFSIPSLIEGMGKQIHVPSSKMIFADPMKAIISAFVAVATPGVSSGLLVAATSRKSNALTQLTATCAESIMESFLLAGLVAGVGSSKSLLGIELGTQFVEPWFIALFVALMFASLLLLPLAKRLYLGVLKTPGSLFLSAVLSVGLIAVSYGLIGLTVVCAGLLVKMTLKAFKVPRVVNSLIFLGPLLF